MNMDLNAVKSQSSQSSLHLRENRNPPALYLQRSLDLLLNIGVKMMSAHLVCEERRKQILDCVLVSHLHWLITGPTLTPEPGKATSLTQKPLIRSVYLRTTVNQDLLFITG